MIHPLSDIVVIRRSEPDKVSAGGIYLAFDPDYREDIGEIVASGPKATNVKPGDMVLFSTNGHQITTIHGEQLVVLREPSIIGVIDAKEGVQSGTHLSERQYAGRQ